MVTAAEVVGGLLLREPALVASAMLTAVFGILMLVAGSLVDTTRERMVGPMLAVGVYSLGIVSAFLIPGAGPAAAMLPMLSVVLVLAGREPRVLATILSTAILGSVLSLLLADLPHPFPPLREPLGSIFASAGLIGVSLLIMGALTDFATDAKQSLDAMRSTMRARDEAFAERTVIVASLGRLEARDTVEATAESIVEELMKLPGIDVAGVLVVDDDVIRVLAMTGPATFPVHAGDTIPSERADHLIERSHDGPWAEHWHADGSFGAYGQAMTESAVSGQAFGPFFEGGRLVGLVAVGTQSDAQAAHLVADLPAVAEFAVTASLLLAPMLRERRERTSDRNAIHRIIRDRAYRPVFQPVVDLRDGRTVGFEALTRFMDGRRPDLVFGLADRVGLGLELERATLASAIAAARALPSDAWLSLNTSPALVADDLGVGDILVARDRPVVLEITEHVAIADYRVLRSAIDRLGPGIRVAVDDAGAGIANFSHLVELRPDIVKVDAGLIRDLDRDLARQAAVVGFVHFAAKAGCVVIAEGIETESERRMALRLGVTYAQGYLFARPASESHFRTLAEPLLRPPTGVVPNPIVTAPAPH